MNCLQSLFTELEPLLNELNFTPEIIQYYAQIVIKSQIFQIARRDDKKYLYLIAFVIHQYYKLNDLLADVLLQSVQTVLNTTTRDHKEQLYQARHSKQKTINQLTKNLSDNLSVIEQIEDIIGNDDLDATEKLNKVKTLILKDTNRKVIKHQLNELKNESNRIMKGEDYYDVLESKSLKLQNRATQIIKNLDFDETLSNKDIVDAIHYFKEKDGMLGADTPLDFLEDDELSALFDETGKLRVSLYKVFLFIHITEAIKSGSLNLKYSYKFRAFENYLIPKELWENEKTDLLERAGLTGFEDYNNVEAELKSAIDEQYKTTNSNIISGQNKHVKFNAKKKLIVSTPKKEKTVVESISDYFPKDRIIPVFEVLSTVNKHTGFLDCLEHHNIKNIRKHPKPNLLIAGITGFGCNHGIRKIAKISRNINQNELEYAVNWHFTNENLIHANDKILELIEILQLPKLYKKDQKISHTSSDGQKFNIHVESLNANYSYKYFGKGKGVTVYVFLDEVHRLFYSTVISSSASEAAYVIDGLMHNDVVQSNIHSTDTAGYSEIVFGACHLLGVSFAPRIKNFRDQKLYSFENVSHYKNLDYQILPSGKINSQTIENCWDELLRFIVTIKLRETTASQLFQRLSSYSRQHPLYKALKEFGKIVKTLFLLKYIDDLELRQAIQKQLNKQESSNKFGKAVFHGNNQEFQQGMREDQLITEGCKRLIENSIICWNYLFLSKLFHKFKSDDEKKKFIEVFKSGSIVNWKHINMQGEYDFSDDNLKDSMDFELSKLLHLKVA